MTVDSGVSLLAELLKWDSKFFGFPIARVSGLSLSDSLITQADAWCSDNQIRCLYFLCDSNDYPSAAAAERGGFSCVDIRMTLIRRLVGERPINETKPGFILRSPRPEDLPLLQDIARVSYQNMTRFSVDPNFPPQSGDRLYETWIKSSCEGYADYVIVAESNGGEAAGYITCHLDPPESSGRIGLVGVAQAAQGQGVATALIQAALDWFADQACREVVVTTQGRNIAAQRLYQRSGFVTHTVELWYHKWYGR